ncbi:MAG: type II toxin-antitoxin system RelE/ParE family toxin [Planctomycetota bacterium]
MSYRVILSPAALADLDRYVEYIAVDQQMPETATRWLEKALAEVQTLSTLPNRCPPAPEDEKSQHRIRMLIVDRCLFLYRVDEATRSVRILRMRHGSQQPLDLSQPALD